MVGAGPLGSLACRWRPRPSIRRRCARSRRRSAPGSTGSAPSGSRARWRRSAAAAASNTVFLTLRDKLADVSVPVTCPRGVLDALPTPLVEGAQIVCHAKPSFYPPRGTLSLQVREIRLVGEGELLARLERLRRLLAAEGLFAPELKRPLPFLPRTVGLVTGQGSAAERDVVENAQRRWPGVRFTVRYAAMQGHARRPRGDRGDRRARPRPGRRRDRGRPRRRLGRGPAAVLRRGAGPRGRGDHHAPGLRDRPRARLPDPRPGRRRPRLDAHRRRQAGGARRRRGGPAGPAAARARPAVRSAPSSTASRTSSRRCCRRPALADPRGGLQERLLEVDALTDRARRSAAPPARPRRGRPRSTSWRASGRSPRWPRCGGATPCSPTPRARRCPAWPTSRPARTCTSGWPTAASAPPRPSVDRIDLMPDTRRRAEDDDE